MIFGRNSDLFIIFILMPFFIFFYKLPVSFLKHISASYSPSICVSLFMLEVILATAGAK
jgi:hypothetical protein